MCKYYKDKLTPKQLLFCQEYLKDLNATQAYYRAKYTAKNDNVAGVKAHKLLKEAKIEKKIDELMQARSKRVEITSDQVLQELAHIAFNDVANYFDDSGRLVIPKDIDEGSRKAITSFTTRNIVIGKGDNAEEYEIKSIKTNDKIRALELIGKHIGMFKAEIDINDNVFVITMPKELKDE